MIKNPTNIFALTLSNKVQLCNFSRQSTVNLNVFLLLIILHHVTCTAVDFILCLQLLEDQQQLAVAVSAERKKDAMIEQLDKVCMFLK